MPCEREVVWGYVIQRCAGAAVSDTSDKGKWHFHT